VRLNFLSAWAANARCWASNKERVLRLAALTAVVSLSFMRLLLVMFGDC
jgi:hypothetical protein